MILYSNTQTHKSVILSGAKIFTLRIFFVIRTLRYITTLTNSLSVLKFNEYVLTSNFRKCKKKKKKMTNKLWKMSEINTTLYIVKNFFLKKITDNLFHMIGA